MVAALAAGTGLLWTLLLRKRVKIVRRERDVVCIVFAANEFVETRRRRCEDEGFPL